MTGCNVAVWPVAKRTHSEFNVTYSPQRDTEGRADPSYWLWIRWLLFQGNRNRKPQTFECGACTWYIPGEFRLSQHQQHDQTCAMRPFEYFVYKSYTATFTHNRKTVYLLLTLHLLRPVFFCYRLLRMEIWKKWRKKSDWKSANAKDVRTKTSPAETKEAPRPRNDVDVPQLRNSPQTLWSSPNRWTPSSIQSSTTEMGKEDDWCS